MWKVFIQQNRTFGPLYQRMSRHPSWVTRTAITCTLAVIVLPLITLIMLGLLVGIVTFFILAAIATVLGWFGVNETSEEHSDGVRQNVRVVDDELSGY